MNHLSNISALKTEMKKAASELVKASETPGYAPALPGWMNTAATNEMMGEIQVAKDVLDTGSLEIAARSIFMGVRETIQRIKSTLLPPPSNPEMKPSYDVYLGDIEFFCLQLHGEAQTLAQQIDQGIEISSLSGKEFNPGPLLAKVCLAQADTAFQALTFQFRFLASCEQIAQNGAYRDRLKELEAEIKQLGAKTPSVEPFPRQHEYNTRFFSKRHGIACNTVQYHFKELQSKRGRGVIQKDRGTRWLIFDYDEARRFDDYLSLNGRKKRN